MRTKDKVKMCPYCEGSIPVQAVECKYCGSSLAKKSSPSPYQTEDSLASLYEPPYAPKRSSSVYGIPEQKPTPKKMYDPIDDDEDEEDQPQNPLLNSIPRPKPSPRKTTKKSMMKRKDEEQEEEENSHISSLLLLSLGGHLFTLAWLLFFFSDHGKLTLEWKSRYWFIYLLLSLPLIYRGWKKITSESLK